MRLPMNRDLCVRWLVCLAVVMMTAAARAQQPTTEYYDTTKTVTLTGILRLILVLPPPSPMVIMVDVSGANGQTAKWFLSGNQMTSLRRDGWQLIGPNAAVKAQETITVTAYLAKDSQKAAKALGDSIKNMPTPGGAPSGPPGFIADIEAKRANLAFGLEITKADGQKLRFGDAP
jgi:hypothetical protein